MNFPKTTSENDIQTFQQVSVLPNNQWTGSVFYLATNWTSLEIYHSTAPPNWGKKIQKFTVPGRAPTHSLPPPPTRCPAGKLRCGRAAGGGHNPAAAGNFRGAGASSPRICPPVTLAVTPRPRGRHRRRFAVRPRRPRLSRRPWRRGGICAGLNTPP